MTLLLIVALALLVGVGLLYRAATTPYLNLTAVGANSESASSAQQKLDTVATAVGRAQSTGKPVAVSVSLTDAEMTSLVAQPVALAEQSGAIPGIDDVVVHAAGAGTLQVQAHLHTLLGTLPIYASIHLSSADQKTIDVSVNDARLGTIPMPAWLVNGIITEVRQQVARMVTTSQTPAFEHVTLTLAPGRITVTATAEP